MYCFVDSKAKIMAYILPNYELAQINFKIHVKEIDHSILRFIEPFQEAIKNGTRCGTCYHLGY